MCDLPVLRMLRPCNNKDASYCLTGQCVYRPGHNTPSCKCDDSHSGPRCGLLNQKTTLSPPITTEELTGICVGMTLLLSCLTSFPWCQKTYGFPKL
uniref:EGF-like domain-containing protein n=1 Tax=Esox lucius TaxID=8010 RepID=A0A6Q2YGQ3_ESOLU